jgi:hypothetical protein
MLEASYPVMFVQPIRLLLRTALRTSKQFWARYGVSRKVGQITPEKSACIGRFRTDNATRTKLRRKVHSKMILPDLSGAPLEAK